MNRLTDNDRTFCGITYGKACWNPLRVVLSSGGDIGEDGPPVTTLTAYAFGYVARVPLGTWLKPYVTKRTDTQRYVETYPVEYGVSLHDGFLQVFHGPQTSDSETTKSSSVHLPWTQWNHRYRLLLTPSGQEWAYITNGDTQERAEFLVNECPTSTFVLIDSTDGTEVRVTGRMEERKWTKGIGWFKWVSVIYRPTIRREVVLTFDEEVGPDKHSWKGGTCQDTIEVAHPREPMVNAVQRFCDKRHRSKSGSYMLTYKEQVD